MKSVRLKFGEPSDVEKVFVFSSKTQSSTIFKAKNSSLIENKDKKLSL